MRAMVMVVLALGCAPGGGGGGGGSEDDGLPWVECTEVEGEAPCCPRITVEDWCLDDEVYEDRASAEGGGASNVCRLPDGSGALSAGGFDDDGYVEVVTARRDDRLGWRGIMRCGADGRVIAFEADRDDGTNCTAACFYDYLNEPGPCALAEPECPELNPFPLSQPLRARCDGDMGCGP